MEHYREFAHIYDDLINQDIDYEKWAKCIYNICIENEVEFKGYLDLACGTGNLTEKVCSYFKDIWAVDLSEDMLCEAEEKFRKEFIKAKFICQDISNLNINKKFNLITCCLDSTNYITDVKSLRNYFKGVHNLLEEGGIFIFDINSYYKLTKILGNNTFDYDDGEVVYIWENDLQDDLVSMYLIFFIKTGELYERFDEQHIERAYKDEDIQRYLSEAGLEVVKKIDCYENKEVTSKTERITYIVKKI